MPADHERAEPHGIERIATAARLLWTGRTTARKVAVLASLAGAGVLAAAAATATITAEPVPGLAQPGPLVVYGLPVARVLLDIAAVVTLGLSLLPKLLEPERRAHTAEILSVARRSTVATALVWLLFALLSLVLQVAEISPDSPLTTESVLDYIATVPAGPGLLLTAGGALACAVLGLLAIRYGESVPAELRFVTAMLGLVPVPLTGHAIDQHLSMIVIELHVLAAAAWTGGLVAVTVCVAPRRGLLAVALPRFSRLATVSVIVVGVSGATAGITELLSTPGVGIDGLLVTTYGRIVVVKMICLILLAALGGHIRFRLLPRISRHEHTALITWAAAEVTVMGLAYGLGAVLARAPVV